MLATVRSLALNVRRRTWQHPQDRITSAHHKDLGTTPVIKGTSEPAQAITVCVVSGDILGQTTADPNGNWAVGIHLSRVCTISARAGRPGEEVSDWSSPITVAR